MLKYSLYLLVFTALVFCISNCSHILYGVRQGKGQLEIVWNTKKLSEILIDPEVPDSVKFKIKLVQEIKRFCKDSLHLESADNYTELYDQKGQPGMYVLTASKPYLLESYEWEFPFMGKFTYKGFFNKNIGEKEQKDLIAEGYDTDLDEVNAWSTLGWFKDPVMSSMLEMNEFKLARVLIHEITHYNIFVKDDMEYNENLASFIGDRGTERYLSSKYGAMSVELIEFSNYLSSLDMFTQYMVDASKELQNFYLENSNQSNIGDLKRLKINSIIEGIDTLPIKNHLAVHLLIGRKDQVNNTFFTDFLTYKKNNATMMETLNNEFDGNIVHYIEAQKKQYGN